MIYNNQNLVPEKSRQTLTLNLKKYSTIHAEGLFDEICHGVLTYERFNTLTFGKIGIHPSILLDSRNKRIGCEDH